MINLKNTNVVLTGATGGIGNSILEKLLESEANVLATWTNDEKLNKLFLSLKEINSKLWVIEDDKRMCEKNSDFSEKFVELSRNIHFLNDKRAKIKLEINQLTGSKIREVKEYTDYWYPNRFSKYLIKLWIIKVINK